MFHKLLSKLNVWLSNYLWKVENKKRSLRRRKYN